MKTALQLYTVRNDLELNPERTLERIRQIGFEAVELAPLPACLSAGKLAKLLQRFELKVAAIHCDLPAGEKVHTVIDLARNFTCRRIIWHGWPRDSAFDSLSSVYSLLDRYNQANDNARQHGLRLGIHNHWWEFETVEGRLPYQLFLQKLAPDIFFQIDTYWVRTAGLQPTAVLKELGDRVEMLHLKDGDAKKGEPMRALGEGVMDFPSILQAATPKTEWLVIELDECTRDIWEAVEQSFRFLHFQSRQPTD